MAPVEVYGMTSSAPVRSVMVTLEVCKQPYEFKVTDLGKGDHMTEEYLKMNPQHNIPTFKEDEFVMNESRAIACYVADKWGDSKLYPKDDPKAMARVNQRLYFDMGVFYKSFGDCVYPPAMLNEAVPESAYEKLREVLGWANGYVKDGSFVAGGDSMTVADLAFLATYSSIKAVNLKQVDLDKYTDLNAWFDKVKQLVPNYEKANGEGARDFGTWINSSLEKNGKL